MSEDLLIRAEAICKSYQLYDRPSERLFSLFRTRIDANARVHHALYDINLVVRRGEKVAVIGRNGAGKSSLLKIVTRAIEPTSGRLEVNGRSHALLQLGAGFHPDFTGRENAYSFLAHMGISGKSADALVDGAVAFAEIEEYVDQPLKTYSTGMAARLMFAISTAIEPDLLVIDEVLGVGDAYFQNKSFERIRELCANNGTTLLLVSHDVYSAAKLCDRMIWIDQGRIKSDGPPSETLKRYEDSIRIQEDARQKHKLALQYRGNAARRDAAQPAFLEIRARNNEPASCPVHFAALELRWPSGQIVRLPMFSSGDEERERGFVMRLLPHTPWGPAGLLDGRRTRVWNNFGAVEHKVGVALFSTEGAPLLRDAELHMTFHASDTIDADVVFIDSIGAESVIGRLLPTPGQWESRQFTLGGGSPGAESKLERPVDQSGGRQGSGRIVATAFDLRGPDGSTSFYLQHGAPATFTFDYRINDADLDERCQIVFAFKRNGVEDVARTIARHLHFSGSQAREGRVEMTMDPLKLGIGKYMVTLMIAAEGYYESGDGRFFSINPAVYDCQSLYMEFEVYEHGSLLPQGTGYVADGSWRKIESRASEMDQTIDSSAKA